MLFLSKQDVLVIHARAIAEFGGAPSLRDERAFESAMVSAEHRHFYEDANLAICAATYAYHLSQAHAFADGNKRTAAAVAEIFLEINGARLNLTNDLLVALFLEIASGKSTREEVERNFSESVVL